MKLKRAEWIILFLTIAYLIAFTIGYLSRQNYEFIMYIGVVLFFLVLISLLHLKRRFPLEVLAGLSIWGLLHMSGGFFRVGSGVLYGYWIFPFLRFDQLVHFFGFGVATLFVYHLISPYLKKKPFSVFLVIVFAGMGIGALNEIIEFIAVLVLPQTGVGGYENTMMDIVFNTFGAIAAVSYARMKEK